MLVCPDCRTAAGEFNAFAPDDEIPEAYRCRACGWEGSVSNGILQALPSNPTRLRKGYFEYYDRLAEEDLSSPIMEQAYAAALNQRTAVALGDIRGKSGCELGVGRGHLAKELLGRGASMTVVDISSNYLNDLVGYGDMRRVQADAEKLPFQDEFDFITCTDVAEHVLNPGNLLFCINDALKAGGFAAVRVPAEENLLLYANHLGCKYDIVHLRTFNESTFANMLRGAGFEVITLEPDGHSLSMDVPHACKESREKRDEVDQVRALLIERGVTPAEFMGMPLSFKASLSKAYAYLAIARKTHKLMPSADQGLEMQLLQ